MGTHRRRAHVGDSFSAELATGYVFGEARLRPYVEQILEEARQSGNERLAQLAERFLRHSVSSGK